MFHLKLFWSRLHFVINNTSRLHENLLVSHYFNQTGKTTNWQIKNNTASSLFFSLLPNLDFHFLIRFILPIAIASQFYLPAGGGSVNVKFKNYAAFYSLRCNSCRTWTSVREGEKLYQSDLPFLKYRATPRQVTKACTCSGNCVLYLKGLPLKI